MNHDATPELARTPDAQTRQQNETPKKYRINVHPTTRKGPTRRSEGERG